MKEPEFQISTFLLAKLSAFLQEPIQLRQPPKPDMGDFSLRLQLKPQEVERKAEEMRKLLGTDFEVAVDGNFVNFKVVDRLLGTVVSRIGENPQRACRLENVQKILIEYSAPNTNKPLHLGHARNSVIGMSLGNMCAYCGDDVVRVNLVNDRGIHICKSMVAYQLFGEGKTPESEGMKGDHFVGEYYVRFEKECLAQAEQILKEKGLMKAEMEEEKWKTELEKARDETAVMQEAREMLRKWEAGDKEVLDLWKKMNSWVISGFQQTYERFGSQFDHYDFESETYKLGKDIIEKGLEDGVLQRRQDGAVEIDLSKFGWGRKVLLRADGTSVYMTQDLGTMMMRHEKFGPDQIVMVVAVEQKYHFAVLFKVLELLGYGWARRLYHYSYELVELPEGRMKSREGTVVDLDELLDELQARVLEVMKNRAAEVDNLKIVNRKNEQEEKSGNEKKHEMPQEILKKNADVIGQAALKYFLISVRPNSRIKFDIEKSLSFEGKTGPYILYQYVRARKILEKNLEFEMKAQEADFSVLDGEFEGKKELHLLLSSMARFPDTVQEAKVRMDQSLIADLLYEIARNFSSFYNTINITRETDRDLKNAMLHIVYFAQKFLKELLGILGIETVEEM